MNANDALEKITGDISALQLQPDELKTFLGALVEKTWPSHPDPAHPYRMEKPVIEDIYKVTASACVVPVFKDKKGTWQVVMGVPGDNSHRDKDYPLIGPQAREGRGLEIFGGHIDLKETPGSTYVAPDSTRMELPREAVAREWEEEMPTDKKTRINRKLKPEALLPLDPVRLHIMDSVTITPSYGPKSIAVGYMIKLTNEEVATLQKHIDRLKTDPEYHVAVRTNTHNPSSGKPEICRPVILPLRMIATGEQKLRFPTQKEFFERLETHLLMEDRQIRQPRGGLVKKLDEFIGRSR